LDLTFGTGGTYGGWDSLLRVKEVKWQDSTPTLKDQFVYTYDAASNRLTKDVMPDAGTPPTDYDEAYSYDDLQRLIDFDRGTLSGGSITSAVRTEDWGLDQPGNWSDYDLDANGDGDYGDTGDLEQIRDHSRENEISDISEGGGDPVWLDPEFDKAGNMTYGPCTWAETGSTACTDRFSTTPGAV